MSLKKVFLSLFWPVGLTTPISQAAQDDFEDCKQDWKRGVRRDPKSFVGDSKIREENRHKLRPHFLNYFIRWVGVFLLMAVIGSYGPLSDIKSNTNFGLWFGFVLIFMTWFSLGLATIHAYCYFECKKDTDK